MTPVTKQQWKSILISVLMAFVAGFVPAWVSTEYSLTKVALMGGISAGLMAVLKFVQKLNTES